jgi:hypothetical protein
LSSERCAMLAARMSGVVEKLAQTRFVDDGRVEIG